MKRLLQRKLNIIVICFMLIMVKINAQSPQSYSSSGTFVTPLGLSSIQVEAYGAGGGGGYG